MVDLVYVVSDDDEGLASNAALCLEHRLFVSGWSLSQELCRLRNGNRLIRERMAVAFDGDAPVGVCIKTRSGFVQVFVRKAYRYMGIGSELIRRVRTSEDELLSAGEGVVGSVHFFYKNRVDVPY